MVEKEGRPMSRCGIGRGILGKRKARSVAVSDDSEDLSDIDDAEVSGYINTEKEASLKKVIWEAMHRGYMKAQGKQRKQPAKEKRSTSTKKTVNLEQGKENKKKASSKINYDALAELLGEPLQDREAEKAKGSTGSDRGDHEPVQPDNEKCDDELDPETEYNEEFDANMYSGYEDEADEYGADEEFGF